MGYVLLLFQQQISIGARYFALFLVVSGGYITQPVILGWVSNTVSGHYKRSVSSAVQLSVGDLSESSRHWYSLTGRRRRTGLE